MFERGPNGYWFEWTVVDDIFFIILGLSMMVYGFHLIIIRQDKFDYMAPIIGLFLFAPGIVMWLGEVIYLLGFPT